eukprot:CAMPEP_0198121484 /NCGR_PEP_ID=MMETSP1442-20131203/32286_1 /TAXON_ID= /ORGANISM="Craspedostauros australis, Strain CCMP3328" /LENGTH=461 /DNA_ID=CAMNT_0043780299 /DNA_START=80 /DNA_END=1465 /DNA_ORIENTATION=+
MAEDKQGTLRQRKKGAVADGGNNKKKKGNSKKKQKQATDAPKGNKDNKDNRDNKDSSKQNKTEQQQQPKNEEAQDETLSSVFFSHPLVRLAPIFLLPYCLYQGVYHVSLKTPELVSSVTFGQVNLRPSHPLQDPRQVLILGPDITDNRLVATGLTKYLELEIGHEIFDTQNYYSRDGSTSWFQFMRFLDSNKNKRASQLIHSMCLNRTADFIQHFHPQQYDHDGCSAPSMLGIPLPHQTQWSNCWALKCAKLISNDLGCAWEELTTASKDVVFDSDFDVQCTVPFVRVLHQVRHPLRSIEQLHTTICHDDAMAQSFASLTQSWFAMSPDLSCLDTMAWYVVHFHNTLLNARELGMVHAMFQLEHVSPCQIATEAGFLDPTAVDDKLATKAQGVCEERGDATDSHKFANAMQQWRKQQQQKSKEPLLELATVEAFADADLQGALKKLITDLGYDSSQDSEFV